MQNFQHDGNVVIEGLWTAITAAKSFDTALLNLPIGGGPGKDATHWVRYTTGGTAALAVGETLTGGTSTETCILVAQAVEIGTAGSSDTGIIFVKKISGTMTATGETLTGGTSTGTVVTAQAPIEILAPSPNPKAVLVTAEAFALYITLSGLTPTVAAGTNHGIPLAAGASWLIRGKNNVKNFKCINAVNTSGAKMHYQLFY